MLQVAVEVVRRISGRAGRWGSTNGNSVHVLENRAVRDCARLRLRRCERTGRGSMLQSLPSATSLMVKSNSLRATKSTSRRGAEATEGVDRDLRADEAGLEARIGGLQRLDCFDVGRERRRRSVQDREIEVLRARATTSGEFDPVRRSVDQLAALNQRRRLREPVRIPERRDLALRLVARARRRRRTHRKRAPEETRSAS